jgi:ferredoxin
MRWILDFLVGAGFSPTDLYLYDCSILEGKLVPTITYVRENVQVEVPEGDTVRYPALEKDVPVYCGLWKFANCHGNGFCGTDRVAVSPTSNTNPLSFMEKFWLGKDLQKNPNLRLACQVRVFGDVSVETQCK